MLWQEPTTPITPTTAVTTPTTTVTGTSVSTTPASSIPPATSDSVAALPTWLLVALLVLVGLIILGMFGLTLYNLSAPRSTLKNLLGLKRGIQGRKAPVDDQVKIMRALQPSGTPEEQEPDVLPLIKLLGRSARVGIRTTRTILAITGFALLGVAIIAIFGLSGPGVRDLRSQMIAAVTTLVAAIVGFYFGSQASRDGQASSPGGARGGTPQGIAPTLTGPGSAQFVVGQSGEYSPKLSGTPAPTVRLSSGSRPPGMELYPKSGKISGIPTAEGSYPIELTASNNVSPDATHTVTITITK